MSKRYTSIVFLLCSISSPTPIYPMKASAAIKQRQQLTLRKTWLRLCDAIRNEDQLPNKAVCRTITNLLKISPEIINYFDRTTGETVLMLAVRTENMAITSLLLKERARVNQADFHGQTALHIATQLCNLDIIGLLLTNGAIVEHCDHEGKTSLDVSAEQI